MDILNKSLYLMYFFSILSLIYVGIPRLLMAVLIFGFFPDKINNKTKLALPWKILESHSAQWTLILTKLNDLLTYHYNQVVYIRVWHTRLYHISRHRYHMFHYSYNDRMFLSSWRHTPLSHNLYQFYNMLLSVKLITAQCILNKVCNICSTATISQLTINLYLTYFQNWRICVMFLALIKPYISRRFLTFFLDNRF